MLTVTDRDDLNSHGDDELDDIPRVLLAPLPELPGEPHHTPCWGPLWFGPGPSPDAQELFERYES